MAPEQSPTPPDHNKLFLQTPINEEIAQDFLIELARTGDPERAARAVRHRLYKFLVWRKDHVDYGPLWEKAIHNYEVRAMTSFLEEKPNHEPIAHDVLAKFLVELAKYGNFTEACKKVGVHKWEIMRERVHNKEFSKAYREAEKVGNMALEDEARRRAVEGFSNAIFQNGMEVGEKREYSDSLLIFLLKGTNPEKYANVSKTIHSGPGGGPIALAAVDPKELSNEQLAALITAKETQGGSDEGVHPTGLGDGAPGKTEE